MWITSCPEAMGWGFGDLEKTVSWDLDLDEASWFSELAEARPVGAYGMPARWLSQWVQSWRCTNSQRIKKLCVSLLMSENLKLKRVNQSFVPEARKSSVFRVFRIPMRICLCYASTCSFLSLFLFLTMSSLGCKALFIINFFVLLSICLSSSVATEFGFEEFSYFSGVLFSYLFFLLSLMVLALNIPQVLVILFFSKCFDAFLIW